MGSPRIATVLRRRRPIVALAVAAALAAGTLSACEMPEEGRYATQQYTAAQITSQLDLVYGTAPNYQGTTVDLKLDVYLPPDEGLGPLPLIIMVHGGGFATGDKSNMAGTARAYAQRGFVAVSLGYRLDPGAASNELRWLAAAQNAIDDGMESVRWLRANAATYRIDTERIGMLGSSAGGAIALGVGAANDPTPGGPLAAYSHTIDAAVSTGAHLTPGIDLGVVTFEPTDAPALMFHYETDTVTGNTDEYAYETCQGLIDAGAWCTFVLNPGSGHTVSLASTSANWTGHIGDFLWPKMRLFTAAGV
jgi:dienelactone hydrolase